MRGRESENALSSLQKTLCVFDYVRRVIEICPSLYMKSNLHYPPLDRSLALAKLMFDKPYAATPIATGFLLKGPQLFLTLNWRLGPA